MTRYLRVGKAPRKVGPPVTVRPPTVSKLATITNFSKHQASAGDLDLTLPSYIAGDIVMVWMHRAASITTPSGWTSLLADDNLVWYSRLVYKVMDGTEGATLAAVEAGTAMTAATINSNGQTLGTPEGQISETSPGVANPDPPSVTPSGGAGTYIALLGTTGPSAGEYETGTYGITVTAAPSGYTHGITQTGSNFNSPSCALAYATVVVTTSEDPGTWTIAGFIPSISNSYDFTVLIPAGSSTGEVAAGNHTHAVNDATDVGTGATTKGDLLVHDGTDYERLPVGSNDQVLTADSAQTLGVKWAASVGAVTGGDSHDHSGGDGAQIDHGGLAGLTDDDHTQYLNTTRHDADDHSATGFTKELLMQDGVTNPPVPIENEAQDDWLYQD